MVTIAMAWRHPNARSRGERERYLLTLTRG
jgi:hypothetical protein